MERVETASESRKLQLIPLWVLNQWTIHEKGKDKKQFLVQRTSMPIEDAAWEAAHSLKSQLIFNLEDKVDLK